MGLFGTRRLVLGKLFYMVNNGGANLITGLRHSARRASRGGPKAHGEAGCRSRQVVELWEIKE